MFQEPSVHVIPLVMIGFALGIAFQLIQDGGSKEENFVTLIIKAYSN
jgi:hypothetical protein